MSLHHAVGRTRAWTLADAAFVKDGGQPAPELRGDGYDWARWVLLGRTPAEALPYLNGRAEEGETPAARPYPRRFVSPGAYFFGWPA